VRSVRTFWLVVSVCKDFVDLCIAEKEVMEERDPGWPLAL
jgi:hypothetical protein